MQSTRLKKNQKVKLSTNLIVTVVDKLGQGGQGTVYKVVIDGSKEERALKWYFSEKMAKPRQFYANIKANIENGQPSPAFVWPEALTEEIHGTFGYIMRIFPRDYKEFKKFLLNQARWSSYEALVNAALNIVQAFMDLHNKGYNYQDLNDGNFSINPKNGDVLICDNDNVMGHGQSSGVVGKARYMAPEVVREEVEPNKQTDRFSLAVVLFILLVGNHPLEGKKTNVPCLTASHDKKFFGTEPVFIFDEHDDSNRPVPNNHVNALTFWPLFPSYIKAAFIQSFSKESLREAKGRLLSQAWLVYLVQLKSSIIRCPHCNREDIFIEHNRETRCSCQKTVKAIGYLKFTKKRSNVEVVVPIYENVKLFDFHIYESSNDFQTVAATILAKPGKFGLQNSSKNRWTVTLTDGSTSTKQPGETAVLSMGAKIDFGNGNTVEVVVNT
jgi:DNA-binding helix-hairpin-helix protein with protein kinase domain